MIKWVIPVLLARSPRPGDNHLPSRIIDVQNWISEAKRMGIRSVICLLSDQELFECYSFAKIDLFQCIRKADIEVIHRPISEYSSSITRDVFNDIREQFIKLPKPCLVHCNAGIERTGQVVYHLVRFARDLPQA